MRVDDSALMRADVRVYPRVENSVALRVEQLVVTMAVERVGK